MSNDNPIQTNVPARRSFLDSSDMSAFPSFATAEQVSAIIGAGLGLLEPTVEQPSQQQQASAGSSEKAPVRGVDYDTATDSLRNHNGFAPVMPQ